MITLQPGTRINVQTQRINFFYPISIFHSFVFVLHFSLSIYLADSPTRLLHILIFHLLVAYIFIENWKI